MSEKIIIRRAVPADVCQLMALIRSWEDETEVPYPPREDRAFLIWITTVIVEGYAVVAVHGDRLIGSIGLMPARFPWNESVYHLQDEWIIVHTDYRKHGTAKALVEHVKRHANKQNIGLMLGIMTGGDDVDVKEKFLAMQGLQYIGGRFYQPASPHLGGEQDVVGTEDGNSI